MGGYKSRNVLIAAAIFSLAVVLRFAYLTDLASLPVFGHPIMDASYHDAWARRIAAGDLMGKEPFFRAPLYPYLLAVVYKLFHGSYLVPRLLQVILGGLTSVIVFVLARRAAGLVAGVAAGILCAAYPVLIYLDGQLLTEPLFTFLAVLGMLVLDTAARGGRLRYWFLGGLALGLALVTRPAIGLFVVAAFGWAVVLSRRRRLVPIMVLAGILLPVAPVAVHNYAVSHEFIPLVWQGGLNLYLGNNPTADGWSATSPEMRKDWWGGYKDQIAIARDDLGHEPTYGEISAYWRDRALGFMKSQPGRFLRLMARKVALFWGSREFPNNEDFNFYKIHSRVLRIPLSGFGVVAPAALIGMVALAGRWKRHYLIYAFVLTYFAAIVVFFVCARYRAPIAPVLAVFAGVAVSQIVDSARKRDALKLISILAGLAGAALIVNLNLAGQQLPDLAQSFTQMGKVYVEVGDESAARAQFQEAIKTNPRWAESYEQLGLLAMKAGPSEEAVGYFRKAIDLAPSQAAPYRALAMIYLSRGEVEEARRYVLKAIGINPYLEDSHNILGSIERQTGDTVAALGAFNRELEINPDNWRTYANLGGLYDSMGDLAGAERSYLQAIGIKPDDTGLLLALAEVYTREGKSEEARSLLGRASGDRLEDINLRYNKAAMLQSDGDLDEARRIYEGILAEAPGHTRSLVNLGVICARQGDDARALELWKRALAVDPANATAKRNIEILKRRGDPD